MSPAQNGSDALHEALGDWRAERYDDALKSVDNAEHLGAAAADVTALRIWILCGLADQGMEKWDPKSPNDTPPPFDAATINERADLMQRAFDETVRYRNQKMEDQLSNFVPSNSSERFFFRTGETIPKVAYVASKLLVLMESNGMKRADDFRQKMRAETSYDPLHEKNGAMISNGPVPNRGNSSETFADDWAATLDEELAYYRLEFVDTEGYTPNSVLGDPSQNFCARFLNTPDSRQRAWDQFVDSLQNNPNSQRMFLVLKMHNPDPHIADAAYHDYLNYLFTKRDWLGTTDDNDALFGDNWRINDDVKIRNTTAGLPLLHSLLNTPRPGRCSIVTIKILWHPEQFDAADAPTLWLEANGYMRHRTDMFMAKENRPDPVFLMEMDQLLDPFRQKFPDVVASVKLPPAASAAQARPALTVSRFWCPYLQAGVGDEAKQVILAEFCPGDNGEIFVSGYLTAANKGEIFDVHLPDLTTKLIDTVDGKQVPGMIWTPKALYAAPGGEMEQKNMHSELARYDFGNGAWAQHTLSSPYMADEIYAIGDMLYLGSARMGMHEQSGGLTKYDWFTNQATMLSDLARKPAQNQFEDTTAYGVTSVYSGPGGKPAITTSTGTFFIQETPGNWPPVFPGRFMDYVVHSGDQSLVFNYEGEAVLIDPKLPAIVPWMAADQPIWRQAQGTPGNPGPVMSPWAAQAIFDPPPGKQKAMDPSTVAFHHDRMFLLTKPDPLSDSYAIAVYDKFHGRKPVVIPLELKFSDADRGKLAGRDFGYRYTVDTLEHPTRMWSPRMTGSDRGLCLSITIAGFWFIPYADIDAYLKSQPVSK